MNKKCASSTAGMGRVRSRRTSYWYGDWMNNTIHDYKHFACLKYFFIIFLDFTCSFEIYSLSLPANRMDVVHENASTVWFVLSTRRAFLWGYHLTAKEVGRERGWNMKGVYLALCSWQVESSKFKNLSLEHCNGRCPRCDYIMPWTYL